MSSIIYMITDLTNGRCYIGQTMRWPERAEEHFRAAARGVAHPLYGAIRKRGVASFRREILCDGLLDVRSADAVERFFIGVFGSNQRGQGYNLEAGGLGKGEISPETRAKLSAAARSRVLEGTSPFSDPVRQRDFATRPRPPGHPAAISAALRGRPKPDEARAAMSAAAKRRVANGDHPTCDSERQREIARRPRNYPTVGCPHCGATGASNLMRRYHFDKCRATAR